MVINRVKKELQLVVKDSYLDTTFFYLGTNQTTLLYLYIEASLFCKHNKMGEKKGISLEDKRAIAYDFYMNTDMTQKEICERISVTEKTFKSWKDKYDWSIHKQAFSITSQNIISNLMEKAFLLSQDKEFNSDAILKVVKAIESLSDKKITISHIINIFKDFISFEFDRDPELAKQINKSMKDYVDYKINAK